MCDVNRNEVDPQSINGCGVNLDCFKFSLEMCMVLNGVELYNTCMCHLDASYKLYYNFYVKKTEEKEKEQASSTSRCVVNAMKHI